MTARIGGRGGWQKHPRSKAGQECHPDDRRAQDGEAEARGFLKDTPWLRDLPPASASIQQIKAVLGVILDLSGMGVGRGNMVSVTLGQPSVALRLRGFLEHRCSLGHGCSIPCGTDMSFLCF